VRAAGRSRRIRKSTLLAATPENYDAADALRLQIEAGFRDEIVHGKRSSRPLAVASHQYLAHKREIGAPLAAGDHDKLIEVVDAFGPHRLLDSITEQEWHDLVRRRHAGNAAQTRERWLNPIVAFLSWCAARPRYWLKETPHFERNKEARKPKHRRARRVAELTPELVLFLIDHAAPHLKGQIAAEWTAGARVSSVLYGCRVCDYVATPGREQITFHDTKNGDPVTAAVHPMAAALMRDFLKWRGELHDREALLFVTPRRDRQGKRLPYRDNGKAWGGQNKTAFASMKRRAIATLHRNAAAAARAERRQDRVRARKTIEQAKATAALIAQVTQHWFRHLLATTLDTDTAMMQGGWRDLTSVKGYKHDVPERRREAVNAAFAGSGLTRDGAEGKKTA
jgi:hypothetical protein